MKKVKKRLEINEKGITLMVLAITIIVLLILSGVSIATLTGESGILNVANSAKIETALGTVKEQLNLLQAEKRIKEEKVTPESLLAEGKIKRTVQMGENDQYYMYYAIKENSFEGMQGLGKGDLTSLQDVFLIDDNLNVKYIAINGEEYGDEIKEKILEDETEIRFSSKVFSEYISKISGIAEEEMKFKWMKNQTSLIISDPLIESLQDLVFFPNLETLMLEHLQLENLQGIENCTKLRTFTKRWGTDIKDYSELSKLNNLETISLNQGNNEDFNNLINSIEKVLSLKTLLIDDCYSFKGKNLSSIGKLKNIETLNIIRMPFSNLNGIEKLVNLKKLSINQNMSLVSIQGIKNLINLQELEITNTKVENVEEISKLTKLTKLDLRNNNITDITPLSNNIELISLDLRENKNIDANRENYTGEKLEKVNKIGEILERNGTIYLDIDKLKLFNNYKKLDLSNQNLVTLDALEGLVGLEYLNLSGNKLTLQDKNSRMILSSFTNLNYLDITRNQITDISCISNLKKIQYLSSSGRKYF
ncbi:MAG: leucine-rich repeat domain-containing protein [Clostridia bacterium]